MIADWNDSILFKTNYKVENGIIDNLNLYIKYPRSDFRQKIALISSDPTPVERKLINRGSYELFKYEFGDDKTTDEIKTKFSVIISEKYYHISDSAFPISLENSSLEHYLKSTKFVESDETEIQEIAQNLTALSKTVPQAISRIVRFFKSYFEYDESCIAKRQTAIETLHLKKGSCEDINHLFNALCRAVGIPTRIVLGFSKNNNEWDRHVWTEVYDPQFGWYPIDILKHPPQIGLLDVYHLKLLTA
ncbi:MAG: transglutaminase-like domain-containing protein, partial [Candidatus Helarchaeota archaeon]